MAFKYITWLEENRPLEGSPKQAEWAASLRRRKCDAIQKLKAAGVARIVRNQVHADDLIVMTIPADKLGNALTQAVLDALTDNQARWWIDRKDWGPEEFLQNAWSDLREKWIRWSPYREAAPQIELLART